MRRHSISLIVVGLAMAGPAVAHSPILICFDNGDTTVTCEAGFSDGSSAAGSTITLALPSQRVIETGQVDEYGSYMFTMPDAEEFEIHLIPDADHSLVLYNDEIVPFEK